MIWYAADVNRYEYERLNGQSQTMWRGKGKWLVECTYCAYKVSDKGDITYVRHYAFGGRLDGTSVISMWVHLP